MVNEAISFVQEGIRAASNPHGLQKRAHPFTHIGEQADHPAGPRELHGPGQ